MSVVSVAYRNPDPRHHADFADLAVTDAGEVLLLLRRCGEWARRATFDFGRPLTFFEANAELFLLRSTDGGRSFSPDCVLYTGLAYDPVLCSLGGSRILAAAVVGEAGSRQERASLRGVLHRHLPQLGTVITVQGIGAWRSEDGGRTWPEQHQLIALPGWENTYNLRKPVQVAGGTILMPVTLGYPWRTRHVGLLRSWDGGASWGDTSLVAEDPAGRAHYSAGVGYWEPALSVLPDGRLVCICVLDDRDSAPSPVADAGADLSAFAPTAAPPRLVRLHSLDSGFTWSVARDTGLTGDFPSLITLPDGRLILAHTRRTPQASQVAVHVSADGGVTWDELPPLREAPGHLFHYSNTALLPDGNLLTVCMSTPPDGVRLVEAASWRV